MNIIPLNAQIKIKDETEKKKNITVVLPHGWWWASFSVDNLNQEKKESNIYRFTDNAKPKFNYDKWKITEGDYIIKDAPQVKDFVYYRNLKLKMLKYSIYPVMLITIGIILKVSQLLSEL